MGSWAADFADRAYEGLWHGDAAAWSRSDRNRSGPTSGPGVEAGDPADAIRIVEGIDAVWWRTGRFRGGDRLAGARATPGRGGGRGGAGGPPCPLRGGVPTPSGRAEPGAPGVPRARRTPRWPPETRPPPRTSLHSLGFIERGRRRPGTGGHDDARGTRPCRRDRRPRPRRLRVARRRGGRPRGGPGSGGHGTPSGRGGDLPAASGFRCRRRPPPRGSPRRSSPRETPRARRRPPRSRRRRPARRTSPPWRGAAERVAGRAAPGPREGRGRGEDTSIARPRSRTPTIPPRAGRRSPPPGARSPRPAALPILVSPSVRSESPPRRSFPYPTLLRLVEEATRALRAIGSPGAARRMEIEAPGGAGRRRRGHVVGGDSPSPAPSPPSRRRRSARRKANGLASRLEREASDVWCAGKDSNLHALSSTSTSS